VVAGKSTDQCFGSGSVGPVPVCTREVANPYSLCRIYLDLYPGFSKLFVSEFRVCEVTATCNNRIKLSVIFVPVQTIS
jgi:hypothetical protein